MKKIIKILLLTLVLSVSCNQSEKSERRRIDYDPDIMPDQVALDVKVIFADSSLTKAILYAGVAEIYNRRKETVLDSGVMVEFFEDNLHTSTLTCEEAVIDDRTKNMLAKRNVVVFSLIENRTLETEILEWNEVRQKIYSTEHVKITTETEIIEGYGFESDPNLTDYKLHKVSGIQNIERK